MKKLSVIAAFAAVLLGVKVSFADVPPLTGTGPAPVYLAAPTEGIYYHVGALNFVVPWQNVNVVYLYDLQGKRNLVGGEAVVVSLWRLQGTIGGVTTLDGEGAPFIGGNLWFENPVPQLAILNQIKPGVFGGWDWHRGASIFGFKAAVPLF